MTRSQTPRRYEVAISPRALNDLDGIAAVIAIDSPVNAVRFIARLRAAIGKLDLFPLRAPIAPEGTLDGKPVRNVNVGRYRILFEVEGCTIQVVGVRHGSRLPLRY